MAGRRGGVAKSTHRFALSNRPMCRASAQTVVWMRCWREACLFSDSRWTGGKRAGQRTAWESGRADVGVVGSRLAQTGRRAARAVGRKQTRRSRRWMRMRQTRTCSRARGLGRGVVVVVRRSLSGRRWLSSTGQLRWDCRGQHATCGGKMWRRSHRMSGARITSWSREMFRRITARQDVKERQRKAMGTLLGLQSFSRQHEHEQPSKCQLQPITPRGHRNAGSHHPSTVLVRHTSSLTPATDPTSPASGVHYVHR